MQGFRVLAAVVLLSLSSTAFADSPTVQIALHDGLVSLHAHGATVSDILAEWQRVGGTTIVNADRIRSAPLTIEVSDVPEEQALGLLLRTISGYVAVPRTPPSSGASRFARIVIMPGAAPARAQNVIQAPGPGAVPTATSGRQPAAGPAGMPAGIPQGGGVTRLVDANGLPVPDDQEGAPPPGVSVAPAGFNRGDARQLTPPPQVAPSPQFVPPVPSAQPPPPIQPTSTPTAPATGAPVPGVIVQPPPAQQAPPSAQQP